jgi:uncharacterized membrane protein
MKSRLEKIVFGAFLFWSAAGLLSTFLLAHGNAAHPGWPRPLAAFVDFCLAYGDPILILLAFATTHLHAARQWTPRLARRWAIIVFILSLAVETLGVGTGFPFGAYRYTTRFGPLLGIVPLSIPLAWNVVLTNSLFIVRTLFSRRGRLPEALLVALLATAYDFVLEPFATTVRGYWIWSAGFVPWQNYAAWFVVSGILVALFAPQRRSLDQRDARPWIVLGVMLLIFAAGRWTS